MKLIISSAELLKGLMAVSKAIPAKSSLPILENFLFDLKGNMLEVTASDSELTLRTQIEVESTAEEGRIAVPAKHMMDLVVGCGIYCARDTFYEALSRELDYSCSLVCAYDFRIVFSREVWKSRLSACPAAYE